MAEKPKNVRVSYNLGATVPIGDFTNVRPEFEISADVPEGSNPTEVHDMLVAKVESWLDDAIDRLANKRLVNK